MRAKTPPLAVQGCFFWTFGSYPSVLLHAIGGAWFSALLDTFFNFHLARVFLGDDQTTLNNGFVSGAPRSEIKFTVLGKTAFVLRKRNTAVARNTYSLTSFFITKRTKFIGSCGHSAINPAAFI